MDMTTAAREPAASQKPSRPSEAHTVHDLGGASGYGSVPHSPSEPPFHHDWERRVFGMFGPALQASGKRPGEFRNALERLAPSDYFDNGYYGRWLAAIELLLSEYGVLAPGELDQRLGAPTNTGPVSRASSVAEVSADLLPPDLPQEQPPDLPDQLPDHLSGRPRHTTAQRKLAQAPIFKVGDAVVVRPRQTPGHTRLAGYVETKRGVIAEYHGAEVLPDSTAHNLGERPQHVYAVAFAATELWGTDAEAGVTVHIDMYECYLAAL